MAAAEVENGTEDFSFVAEVEIERNQLVSEADTLLAEIARSSRRPTDGEMSWFSRELRWSERQVKDELRRMSNVLRLTGIAGSPADRAAAQVEADTAAAVLAKEQPKLQAKIDELQAKLRSLDADARLSAKRRDDQAEAVEQLRQHAPQHVRERARRLQTELDFGIGKRLSEVEIRINELACNLDASRYRSEAAYLESLQRSCREAVEETVASGFIKRRLSGSWPSIRASMEAELESLEAERDQLKAEIVAGEQAIRQTLDFYAK